MPAPFAAIALLLSAMPSHGQQPPVPFGCAALVGTFLTRKTDTSGTDIGRAGRTVLSLTESGFAIMTDPAQGGIANYQAFGVLQGPWTCTLGEMGIAGLRATLLDFTYANEADPEAKVARVEISGRLGADGESLSGTVEVYLFALLDDPFSDATPLASVSYAFEGQRVGITDDLPRD